MYISKADSLLWFEFFSQLSENEQPLSAKQTEIAYAVLSQIELATEALHDAERKKIPGLKTLKDRTYYIGNEANFPKGCISCLFGSGLTAIRKTNRCNAACPFCYDYGMLDSIAPIGEGMWDIGGTRFRTEDIPMLLDIYSKPSGVAYVYLEPFMEIEKYYPVVAEFAKAGVYQHLYTNGISANKEKLKALGEAGLNEIRFNLGASLCADKVLENICAAKEYIPMVGVETPMTNEFYKIFDRKYKSVLQTGIDFINFAELHLNPNNLQNYFGENLYMYRHGYVSPISSRLLTLKTMQKAARDNWGVVIHDCCNRTKFFRDLHLKAKEGGWFGLSAYGCEFDEIPFEAFLPVLSDDNFRFLKEEELPKGYRIGELVL